MGAQVRPADLPTGYACGTNAAYVNGCHCDRCKAAHREQARDRQRRVEEAAAEVQPNPEVPRKVIVKAGVEHLVRACPGCNGKPCVKGGAWLRVGEVCRACVDRAVVWNGLVDAGPARAHMRPWRAHRDARPCAPELAAPVAALPGGPAPAGPAPRNGEGGTGGGR